MDLGLNAYTVASHLTMIGILIVLAIRAMTFMDPGQRAAIAIACLALAIERIYYVFARFLLPSGVNLWAMHPAPEVLSLVVGVGLYGVMVPMIRAGFNNPSNAWTKVTREVALIGLVWLAIATVLF